LNIQNKKDATYGKEKTYTNYRRRKAVEVKKINSEIQEYHNINILEI